MQLKSQRNQLQNISLVGLNGTAFTMTDFKAYINMNRSYAAKKISYLSSNSVSFWTIALIHVAILFFIFFSPVKVKPAPIISFTVNMMDPASSQTAVSTAASSPTSIPQPQKQEQVEEKKEVKAETKQEIKPVQSVMQNVKVAQTEQKKQEVKKAVYYTPTTNAPVSMASVQHNAVVSDIPASYDAAYLHNNSPTYPPLSRKKGEEGNILLNVFVNAQGAAEKVDLQQGSGFSRLDQAALDTVKTWRFAAAKHGDSFVSSWVQVPIKFVLEN